MITAPKAEVLQGTLDLLVLKTLDTLGPLHGFGIARRIQQVSNDTLLLNQGTLYPALVRLEQRGNVVGVAGAKVNQIARGIVAAGGPDGRSVAFVDGRAIPAIAAGLSGASDVLEAP